MKKPIFADIAELVGGLLAAEKKKKRGAKPLKEAKGLKRRTAGTKSSSTAKPYAPSKYDVIGVQKLVKALPARPARLPVVLRRGRPPGSKNKKKKSTDLLEANDELEEARALLDKAVVDLRAAEASAASSSDADRNRVLAKIRSARTAVTVKTKKFEKATAKAEAANESVEERASPELLDYLERPDFFETLTKMSPALKKLQESIVAKRAPPVAAAAAPASPSAFTEAKKRVDASRAKIRAAAAKEARAATLEAAVKGPEPLIGVGRFLGRFE